jgi:hypothetical protein
MKRRWLAAQPTVIGESEQKAEVLGEFARRNRPKAGKWLMLGPPGDRQPNRQEPLDAAAKTTIARLALSAETGDDDEHPSALIEA